MLACALRVARCAGLASGLIFRWLRVNGRFAGGLVASPGHPSPGHPSPGHQAPFTTRKLCGMELGILGPIFLNFLLVLTATGIASGVNHSGDPDRHATPLGRREERFWTPCSAKDRAASRSFSS